MTKQLRRYDTVLLDGAHYVPTETPPFLEDAAKLLTEIYSVLWTESYYDPMNEHTRKFAKSLADKMTEVNKLLGFRQ